MVRAFHSERSERTGSPARTRISHFLFFLVPKKGLEPSHPCEYMDLNHARLPIPPLRLTSEAQHRMQPVSSRANCVSFKSPKAGAGCQPIPQARWQATTWTESEPGQTSSRHSFAPLGMPGSAAGWRPSALPADGSLHPFAARPCRGADSSGIPHAGNCVLRYDPHRGAEWSP